MSDRIQLDGQSYTVTDAGDHWRVRWYKTAPTTWPESPCRICGKPTIDEGGYCSNECLDKGESSPTAHPEYPEALVPKGAQGSEFAIGAMCDHCKRGETAKRVEKERDYISNFGEVRKGQWFHSTTAIHDTEFCEAGPIHEALPASLSTPEAAIRQAIVQEGWK